jgi:glucose uptake protein GlcU
MKNQSVIIIGAIVLLVIVGGGYFFLSPKQEAVKTETTEPEIVEETIETLSSEELGLTLTAGAGNRRVIMEIANLEGISSLDYELSYTSKGDIPRGVVGAMEVTSKDKQIKKELVLGTCSDVCHYDEEVSDIKLILKVTKTDGKVYHAGKNLEI